MRYWKVGVFIGLFILGGQALLAQKITTSGTLADDNWVMQSNKPLINKIEEITLPDGSKRWISASKLPRHDEEGKIIGTA